MRVGIRAAAGVGAIRREVNWPRGETGGNPCRRGRVGRLLIAAPARKMCDRNTITGSIGVLIGKLNARDCGQPVGHEHGFGDDQRQCFAVFVQQNFTSVCSAITFRNRWIRRTRTSPRRGHRPENDRRSRTNRAPGVVRSQGKELGLVDELRARLGGGSGQRSAVCQWPVRYPEERAAFSSSYCKRKKIRPANRSRSSPCCAISSARWNRCRRGSRMNCISASAQPARDAMSRDTILIFATTEAVSG